MSEKVVITYYENENYRPNADSNGEEILSAFHHNLCVIPRKGETVILSWPDGEGGSWSTCYIVVDVHYWVSADKVDEYGQSVANHTSVNIIVRKAVEQEEIPL